MEFQLFLTNNPAECISSYDRSLISQLSPRDQKFLEHCYESQTDDNINLSDVMTEWVVDVLKERQEAFNNLEDERKESYGNLSFNVPVNCELWSDEFNERDERNLSHKLAESLDADWIMSIDGDEVIEDRITNKLIQKMD